MKKTVGVIIVISIIGVIFLTQKNEFVYRVLSPSPKRVKVHTFDFTSIDTMKYSRDLSREMLQNNLFDQTIDLQVSEIASAGATHVAIGTPYDEEFVPFLKRWVMTIRKFHLHVWFRGNFSGWEQWFGYGGIDSKTHLVKIKEFITTHPELFENGDIFSSCPECENGELGDPRKTGDIEGYRKFLIEEYAVTKSAFMQINKRVRSNYFSMNADVAKLIMDRETTKALDGVVVLDHYVQTPEKMVADAVEIAENSGGTVTIGEFGVPIPSIHGDMTEKQQADWINKAMETLINTPQIGGVNYWVGVGGSTELWHYDGSAKLAAMPITKWFTENAKRDRKNNLKLNS